MTNEEKAKDIATRYSAWADSATLEEFINQSFEISYNDLLKMAQWKEKQMIAKTKTFLKEIARVCDITDANSYSVDERYLLTEFEKIIKGE